MIQKIFYWIDLLKWVWKGKPYKKYSGFHCGCCGKYVKRKFKVPTYESNGDWADTWGLCDECGNGNNKRAFPNFDEEWLRKKAAQEDGSIVSVGGLISNIDTVKCSNHSIMITPKSGDKDEKS